MHITKIMPLALILTTVISSHAMMPVRIAVDMTRHKRRTPSLNNNRIDFLIYRMFKAQEANKQYQGASATIVGTGFQRQEVIIPCNDSDKVGYFREYARLKLIYERHVTIKPDETIGFSFEGCTDHPNSTSCYDAKVIRGSTPRAGIVEKSWWQKCFEKIDKKFNPR